MRYVLLIVAVGLILVSMLGCGQTAGVLVEDIDTAQKLCEPNGGLSAARTHYVCPKGQRCQRSGMSATCKNGAEFSKG